MGWVWKVFVDDWPDPGPNKRFVVGLVYPLAPLMVILVGGVVWYAVRLELEISPPILPVDSPPSLLILTLASLGWCLFALYKVSSWD